MLARRGASIHHDILVRPPIEPPPPTRSETVLREVMTRVNLEFEEVVRQLGLMEGAESR